MLEPLLYPDSVAVIGASRTPGKVGYAIVDNLVKFGYGGRIVLINPSSDSILGIPCHPDLKTYGHPVDLAVISLPTKLVKGAVQASITAGARAIVVITAGFKEATKRGRVWRRRSPACARHGESGCWGPTAWVSSTRNIP